YRHFSKVKRFSQASEDGSAGGGWGEECRAVRAKIEAAPATCSFRAEPSKILFSFLEEFWWRAQIGNRKEYFAWRRALASGGGAASFV
ncbi:hypothetical protein KJ925_01800, partial [Patescibacteria group bacterium]|nr:hypothetical protein [Patescibacteria group bacterium]